MDRPELVLLLVIEPETKEDQKKLAGGLERLMAEDPTFRIDTLTRPGQTILHATSEMHLEVIVERLKREFDVVAAVGEPQVVYKETPTRPATGEGRYMRQTGGGGQYGHAKIRLFPGEPGSGYIFENRLARGAIPAEFIEAIDEGVQEARNRGVLAGYPVDDVRIELCDGSFHDTDSSEMAFRMAGSMAFQEAANQAEPVLLEPVMRVEVVVPEKDMGDVIGDLNSRRGRIEGMETRGTTQIINAMVPLSEMLGYATAFRSRTEGGASYSMQFDRYERVRGGPDTDNEDRCAPVIAPRTPAPRGKDSSVALPEPD